MSPASLLAVTIVLACIGGTVSVTLGGILSFVIQKSIKVELQRLPPFLYNLMKQASENFDPTIKCLATIRVLSEAEYKEFVNIWDKYGMMNLLSKDRDDEYILDRLKALDADPRPRYFLTVLLPNMAEVFACYCSKEGKWPYVPRILTHFLPRYEAASPQF